MRIALLVTDLERGGTPLRLARLARGLAAAGVDVSVGCLAPPGPVSIELNAAGIATFSCDARGRRDLGALRRLYAHLKRVRPDILHATLTHANVAARLVGLGLRIPVLTSTATIEVERRWHIWAERLTAQFDRGHTVHSAALAEHVRRSFWLSTDHVHIIPPSLAPLPSPIARTAARTALGIPPHEFVVVWAGRFDPVKRLDRVIACAEILCDAPTRFLLAGDGPDRPAVEQLVRLSSASRFIHLLGWQSDLTPILSAADAFVCTSLTEGMPNAVLEAMACGAAAVGSDIPALRELSGGGTRLLLAEGDDARHYAAALRILRDDPARRSAIGAAAAAWARGALDPQATIGALLSLYERIARKA